MQIERLYFMPRKRYVYGRNNYRGDLSPQIKKLVDGDCPLMFFPHKDNIVCDEYSTQPNRFALCDSCKGKFKYNGENV